VFFLSVADENETKALVTGSADVESGYDV